MQFQNVAGYVAWSKILWLIGFGRRKDCRLMCSLITRSVCSTYGLNCWVLNNTFSVKYFFLHLSLWGLVFVTSLWFSIIGSLTGLETSLSTYILLCHLFFSTVVFCLVEEYLILLSCTFFLSGRILLFSSEGKRRGYL